MTLPLLNFSSSPYRLLTANSRLTGFGAVATLPAEQYDRWLYRVALVTTLVSTDILTPSVWEESQRTAYCWFLMGGLADNNSIIDSTWLGDENVAEYTAPILIPKRTDFFVRWPDVIAASASKCNAILSLVTV